MEAALRQQVAKRGNEAADIDELVFDAANIREILPHEGELLKSCTELRNLQINGTGLASARNFPPLANLRVLSLTDNKLTSSDIPFLTQYPALKHLILSGNKIDNTEALAPLAPLTSLECIELDLNPLTQDPSYKAKLFQMFPSVRIVDFTDRDGNPVDEAEVDRLDSDSESSEDMDFEEDPNKAPMTEFVENVSPRTFIATLMQAAAALQDTEADGEGVTRPANANTMG
eukprot:GHVU01189498.1.p1 GENE.GHVU01189498.1~~GHVU01189498.1.p1  ORF type:complete len:230 (+),score=33.42 GHVU01189498.1:1359-2048(+)